MDPVTYEWLWEQIESDINNIKKKVTIKNSDITPCNFKLRYGGDTKEVIRSEYERIKEELKERCYISKVNEKGEINLIDQHKIAACLCKAFVNKKVFSFTLSEETSEEMIRSNYELAYTVSLRVIFLYLEDYYADPKTKLDVEIKEFCIKKLQENESLYVPTTTPTHDTYNLGRIKTLAMNDFYGLEVDLLMYADMLYWIEYYNKHVLENMFFEERKGKG